MKPIEAGCLAVITEGDFTGKDCKVLEFVDTIPNRPDLGTLRWWKVEPYFYLPKPRLPFAKENHLMRIDGYEAEAIEVLSCEI